MDDILTINTKKNIFYWGTNILLILLFLQALIRNISRYTGLPFIETLHGWLIIILTLVTFVGYIQNKSDFKQPLYLVSIYMVYMLFCLYQILIQPQMSRNVLLSVPEDNFDLLKGTTLLFLQIISVPYMLIHWNIKQFSKIIVIINSLYLPYYFLHTDTSYYILNAMSDDDAHFEMLNMVSFGFIEPFVLSHITALTILCVVYLFSHCEKNIALYICLFISLIINVYGLILAGKRGPLLMLVVTLMIYYVARGMISKRLMCFLLIIAIFLWEVFDNLVLFFMTSDFSSGIFDRFSQTFENGASSRFGEKDTEYIVAINQITNGPIFGTYFRSLSPSSWTYGHYPHNVILELLMTFGVIFTVPFLVVFIKAIVYCIHVFKNNSTNIFVALFFSFSFLCYMTSGTIFLSYDFWIPLAMVCCLHDTKKI